MTPTVSIVGKSGSGKTTLLEKIVKELSKKGYQVGVIKHDAHTFEIDHPGKDSYRHKKAGARTVAISSPKKFAVVKDVKKEWPPERLISSYLHDADIVITEGYKKGPFPKIEVLRKALSASPVCIADKNLLAIATDAKIKAKVPLFDINDHKKVAAFIEKTIIKRPQKPASVSLTADGVPVSLKPFIEELLRDGITGMVRSLKGCKGATDIEIRIKK